MAYVPMYPLLLRPALHTKIWGGRRLETVLNIALPTDEQYGEAWIMHDTAVVENGPLRGSTVAEVVRAYRQDVVGPYNDPALGMPLLAKFLDAREWLSIQVHPDDEQARQLENEPRGKTEAWYVVAAEPGSRLVVGVQPRASIDDLKAAIAETRLESLLVYADVGAGDVLFVSPGTIHALGPGVLIYEIQQSSDITYRLYDYGRPREIHVEKALAVSRTETVPVIAHTGGEGGELVPLVSSGYFETVLHQLRVGDYARLDTGKQRFHILTCIEGETVIEWGDGSAHIGGVTANATAMQSGDALDLRLGQTALIPASLGAYRLRGRGRVLRSYQP
ncbi:MAG: type I phosphomannose isomerase catalytic subunit [bacterium]|nr:type I phosphomannose isomerase catalytic subunit [bacterium]